MASIYLSSTYSDLKGHRQAAFDQLVRMKHQVTAMEHYVARDDRPLDACLLDVAKSDLYVGLFAWRYGHVPARDNPDGLSITELEYLRARQQGIPRLLFLLDEAAAWPPGSLDAHTGEGDAGARIRALRKCLGEERVVTFFTSPEDLASKLAAAIHLAGAISEAADASFDLASLVGADAIDRPETLFSQSYTPYLIDRIAGLGDARLLQIDLKDGAYWWSTKLYALALLAHEYTSVEWLLIQDAGGKYVGMVRPRQLCQALAGAQPELEVARQRASGAPGAGALDWRSRSVQVLQALVGVFAQHPGGEVALRFLVSSDWIRKNVPGLSEVHVERSGPFDPLATYQLLQASTPFVPVTQNQELVKVIDRVGVATEIARTVIERRLGRR